MDKQYSALAKEDTDIKNEFGYPTKRQLVYYKDKLDSSSMVNVVKFRIDEKYQTWALLQIMLEDNNTVLIHSSYFKEMQNPSFVKDMMEQENV